MITFDVDAESAWLAIDPDNRHRPGRLSQGRYGAVVGVARILEILRDYQIPGSFFIPGWVAETHAGRLEPIVHEGHEIGHHGYLHEAEFPGGLAEEQEVLARGIAALETTFGVRPVGYRPPSGETTDNTLALIAAQGFQYSSSRMDQIEPYRHRLPGGGRGPVELPWHWNLDDMPYAWFSITRPKTICTNEHILDVWKAEFDEIYRWGGLYNLIMHPQVIGRPSRLAVLRGIIEHIRAYEDVWFARCCDVATAWEQLESSPDSRLAETDN